MFRLPDKSAGAVVVAVLFLGAGCVPVLVEKQPGVDFSVVDDVGKPVSGAELHFARYTLNPVKTGRELFKTSTKADGLLQIDEVSEFQTVYMVPDLGAIHYGWSWCVDKAGYRPVMENNVVGGKPAKTIVVLLPETQYHQCTWNVDEVRYDLTSRNQPALGRS